MRGRDTHLALLYNDMLLGNPPENPLNQQIDECVCAGQWFGAAVASGMGLEAAWGSSDEFDRSKIDYRGHSIRMLQKYKDLSLLHVWVLGKSVIEIYWNDHYTLKTDIRNMQLLTKDRIRKAILIISLSDLSLIHKPWCPTHHNQSPTELKGDPD